jgi:nucleoside-diphosphate-sugar epimerase
MPKEKKIKNRLLITGATGFVGRGLLARLTVEEQWRIRACSRSPDLEWGMDVEGRYVPTIDGDTDWQENLADCEAVVHLAARVHRMHETTVDSLPMFRLVNVDGTLQLARQAAAAGVRRFIFLSSIKVNGDYTKPSEAFSSEISSGRLKLLLQQLGKDTISNQLDSYTLSKFEAEQGLKKIAEKTNMEVVIIRPPLVYGDGVKGNFLKMMKWIYGGIPLPLGSIENQRSLVYIDNLISLIKLCIEHPSAVNQTFLVSDGQDLSTSQLFRHLAPLLGKESRLINFPQRVLKSILLIMGRKDIYLRLCENLQVDIQKTRDLLNWKPPVSFEVGLENTAKSWLEDRVT